MSWERLAENKAVGGMGFRNFRDFNLAMLGKQGWRIITKPESLVSRIYKARYFAESNFLEAGIGNNPSFVWRSIWEAKQVILDGSRWRIGYGEMVNVLGHPWLLDKGNPFITTETQGLDSKKVKALMHTDKREWEVDIIRDIFNKRDQDRILQVQIDDTSAYDILYWSREITGNYSVKSAYNMLQQ